MNAASLSLRGVAKAHGGEAVIEAIDLDVAAGEFVALVGPSGCGKSTLLRLIAGLDVPDAGSIRIGGRVVDALRPADRDIAMVFQSYALYPHLTVFDNLATPLRLRDLAAHQRLPFVGPWLGRARHRALHDEVRRVAATLGLEGLLDRKPGTLSGGQRQRVALGRAIVRRPLAFLMDEPLSNLDATLRGRMRVELAELHRALAATVVYVTHDQAEALTMADRIAVMAGGRLLQIATPEAVYDDPAELAVARFVGSPEINVLPGAVDGRGVASAFGVPLPGLGPLAKDDEVTLALRPEHLSIGRGDGRGWSARVVHREHLGAERFVHVALDDAGQRLVVRTTPEADAGQGTGERVRVVARDGRAFAFDRDGERLRPLAQAPASTSSLEPCAPGGVSPTPAAIAASTASAPAIATASGAGPAPTVATAAVTGARS